MDEQIQKPQPLGEQIQPQPRKRFWGSPLVIVILVSIVVFASIGYVLTTNKKSQETAIDLPLDEPIEAPVKTEKAVISILPEVQTVKLGQLFIHTIRMDAKKYPLTVVKIVLQYDPALLSLSTFEPGTFYAHPTVLAKTIDNVKGAALLTLGSLVPQDGMGTIASFSAFSKNVTVDSTAFITFSTSTYAYVSTKEQQTEEKNVLTEFRESAITIVP